MIPDPDHINTLMAESCGRITEAAGWDQPPRLFALYATDVIFDAEEHIHTIGARQLPIPEVAWQGEPGACLLNLAVNLAWLLPAPFVDLLMDYVDPTFAGYLFMVESWHGTQAPPPGLGLADVPGSVECRTGVAVDTAGNVYQVTQERGQDPVTDYIPVTAAEGVQAGGRIVNALRLMTLTACERLPAEAHQMPKLLRPPVNQEVTVEDMLRRMGLTVPDLCSCSDSGDPAHHRAPMDPSLN